MPLQRRKISKLIKTLKDGNRFGSDILSVVQQSDGKLIVGGLFTDTYTNLGRNYLLRLNTDGTIDSAFCANAVENKFNSFINSICLQPDGKILIGGAFTNYGGVAGRSYLIRLNADSTLDTTFSANISFSASVSTVFVRSDGKILVSGSFTNYGGVTGRSWLVSLNSDGTVDTTTGFNTNAIDNSLTIYPYVIKEQSDGKIILAGDITNYKTTNRSFIVRLNSNGTLDSSFCTAAVDGGLFNNSVYAVSLQSDGKILVGGFFTNYKTTNRNYLIRLNSDGSLDTAFCTAAVDGGLFNSLINDITVQSTGHIILTGLFTNYQGFSAYDRVVRLNSNGTVDASYSTAITIGTGNAYSTSSKLCLQSDQKVVVYGGFNNWGGVSGFSKLTRVLTDGTLDTAFCINASEGNKLNGTIYAIYKQPDGKILIGGSFYYHSLADSVKSNFIRLNADGTLDTAFMANISQIASPVLTIDVQSDGKILIGGSFTSYQVVGRSYLLRLNTDGTIDSAFCANAVDNNPSAAFNNAVRAIKVQSDGKILVGGSFTNYRTVTGNNLCIRLNSDGTLDSSFTATVSGGDKFNAATAGTGVGCFALDSVNSIYIGGAFINYNAVTGRNRLIKVGSTGTLDSTWTTNASGTSKFSSTVNSIIAYNSYIYIGGNFTNHSGSSPAASYFLRLDRITGLGDSNFSTTTASLANTTVNALALDSSGKICISGNFTNSSGVTNRNYFAKINTSGSGSIDTVFCANAVDNNKFRNSTYAIHIDSQDNVFVGAGVSTFYGYKLSNTGPKLSAFTVIRKDGLFK